MYEFSVYMDVCVLTGVECEGGVALARILVEKGFRVYGLASEKRDWGLSHIDFVPLECPQHDLPQAEAILQAILDHEKSIAAVVHLAHAFSAQSFQELSTEQMVGQVQRNLTLPLLVNKILLPGVIQGRGHFLQACHPVGKGPRVGGTLYLTLEDGLTRFYRRLYEEVRAKGVRVTCVRPVGVLGNTHDPEPSVISGEFLAETIAGILLHQGGGFFTDLEIRPEPRDAAQLAARPAQPISLASMRLPPALEKDAHKRNFTLPVRKSTAPKKKLEWADRPIDYGPAPDFDDDDEEEGEEDNREDVSSPHKPHRSQASGPATEKKESSTPAQSAAGQADRHHHEGNAEGRNKRRRRRRRGRHREEGQNGGTPAAAVPVTTEEAAGRAPEPQREVPIVVPAESSSATASKAPVPLAETSAAGVAAERKSNRSNRNRKRRPAATAEQKSVQEPAAAAVPEEVPAAREEVVEPQQKEQSVPLSAEPVAAPARADREGTAAPTKSPVKRVTKRPARPKKPKPEQADVAETPVAAEEGKQVPVKKVPRKRVARAKAKTPAEPEPPKTDA